MLIYLSSRAHLLQHILVAQVANWVGCEAAPQVLDSCREALSRRCAGGIQLEDPESRPLGGFWAIGASATHQSVRIWGFRLLGLCFSGNNMSFTIRHVLEQYATFILDSKFEKMFKMLSTTLDFSISPSAPAPPDDEIAGGGTKHKECAVTQRRGARRVGSRIETN